MNMRVDLSSIILIRCITQRVITDNLHTEHPQSQSMKSLRGDNSLDPMKVDPVILKEMRKRMKSIEMEGLDHHQNQLERNLNQHKLKIMVLLQEKMQRKPRVQCQIKNQKDQMLIDSESRWRSRIKEGKRKGRKRKNESKMN